MARVPRIASKQIRAAIGAGRFAGGRIVEHGAGPRLCDGAGQERRGASRVGLVKISTIVRSHRAEGKLPSLRGRVIFDHARLLSRAKQRAARWRQNHGRQRSVHAPAIHDLLR